VVPDDAGGKDDAFFKVSVLDEELRVMNPDLSAIQVRQAAAPRLWWRRRIVSTPCVRVRQTLIV
jgi:hypothetical protein